MQPLPMAFVFPVSVMPPAAAARPDFVPAKITNDEEGEHGQRPSHESNKDFEAPTHKRYGWGLCTANWLMKPALNGVAEDRGAELAEDRNLQTNSFLQVLKKSRHCNLVGAGTATGASI